MDSISESDTCPAVWGVGVVVTASLVEAFCVVVVSELVFVSLAFVTFFQLIGTPDSLLR